jgi:pimeloyl-ACP methyl ester carboxylesterase
MVDAPVPIKVTASDGAKISVYVSGRGRPLVAVHGTSSYHGTWHQVRTLLEPHVQLFAMDRRGRGASGDGPAYSLAHECADVLAVVEAAARETGKDVDLLGHSYGGNVSFAAAAVRGTHVRRLVLYEGWPPPNPAHRAIDPELIQRLDDLLAQREPERMLLEFYRDVVKMTPTEIDALRASPTWPERIAAAGTVPREIRAFAASAFDPQQAARITMPVLLLVGDQSPDDVQADPDLVAAALPDARVRVLTGQAHMAHVTAPAVFVAEILAFLREHHE